MLIKRLLATVLAAALCMAAVSPGNENILRLHVIANSDGAADQAAKLAVRDAILAYEADMAACADSDAAKAALMADGEGLLAVVESTLRQAPCTAARSPSCATTWATCRRRSASCAWPTAPRRTCFFWMTSGGFPARA